MDSDPNPEPQSDPQSPTTTDPLTNEFATLNDLTHDLASLQELAARGSWRSILDKVARARALSLLQKPHEHLTYLAFHVLALSKLRRFTDASAELDSLENDDLDAPHYLYQTYPTIYPTRSGSMVPFSLRWLHALLPVKLGQRQLGLDRFYTLLDFVRSKLKHRDGISVNIWKKREVFIINSIIGHHLINKEFSVCLNLIHHVLSSDPSNPILISKLGYIQMQIGDLESAKSSFNRVEAVINQDGKSESEFELKNLVNRNKAMVYMVGKDYVSAVREYEECIERDPMDVVAINNKAICLMYLRDLPDSIKVLENSLERVPTVALNETLVVNLCSMYELAYVNHSDIKRTLSNWIARVAPDDFDSSCTRI
jgi:tetratricopeptide (TPR) repeat protein